MIGTDFPRIKGIGPKTGLKLIKEYSTIEAVCEAKGKDIPDRLDEIREVFQSPLLRLMMIFSNKGMSTLKASKNSQSKIGNFH